MVRHWVRTRAAGWRWRGCRQRLRRPADARRPGHRRDREVLRRRLRGRDPDPAAGRDDAVHPPPVRRSRRASSRSSTSYVVAPPTREERAIVPIPELNRAAVQAVNVARSISEQVTAVFITDDPEAAAELRERWERQVPGVPLVVVESPYRALVGPARRLPRRPRPRVAAGQAGADHVRRPARVRRPQLVGADPVQPVRAAPAQRAARATAHGRSSACPTGATTPTGSSTGGPTRASTWPLRDDGVRRRRRTSAGGRRPGPGLSRWYRDAARRPVEARLRLPSQGRPKRGGFLFRGRIGGTPVPARRGGAVRWPNRPADRRPRRRVGAQAARPSWSASTSSRSTGRSRSTPTSPAGPRTPSACWTSPRRPPRPATTSSRPCCSRPATSGAAIVDEATERGADLVIAGLPFRRRFGGDFAIGRTIPYILKNAPCAVWVIREAMPEEQA